MKRVVILVLGGRITPNLVGLLTLDPDIVGFMVSEDTPDRYENIRDVVEQFARKDIKLLEPKYLPAYDPLINRNSYLETVQEYLDCEIIFDVTSAPKIMGFAAYEVARFLHQRIIIVDTINGQMRDLIPPVSNPTPIQIDLNQYLSCYGRQPVDTFKFEDLSISQSQAIKAASYLATGGEPAVEMLNKLRRWSQGKGKRTIPFKKTKLVSASEWVVLNRIQSFGLIANLEQQDDGCVKYTILNEHDWKFLEGTWLEVFVWNAARQCESSTGATLLQPKNVGLSFEIPSDNARKEIDVGYVYYGQFIHASCKTEANSFKTRYLDELSAVSSLVGGRFASRIFVTNAFPPSPRTSDYKRFLAQAKAREIVVVTGENLPKIQEILKKQAINPDYSRI